jgi:hypothetical protein
MVVGLTSTCTIIVYHRLSSNPAQARCTQYNVQHYVIKFVSDLWQVGSFHRVFQFSQNKNDSHVIIMSGYEMYMLV